MMVTYLESFEKFSKYNIFISSAEVAETKKLSRKYTQGLLYLSGVSFVCGLNFRLICENIFDRRTPQRQVVNPFKDLNLLKMEF